MSVRINYEDGYLYCNLSDNASEYSHNYDSAEECLNDYKQDIIDQCKEREYDEYETQAVLEHYDISFGNYAGEWKNQY